MDDRKLKAFIRLVRLPYWLIEGLLCMLFMITFQRGFYKPVLMSLAVLTVAFIGAGGAAINDYFDRESDAVTHPDRPIPSHQISPSNAVQFAASTYIAGLLVSFAINPLAFEIAALTIVLFILYPRVFKRYVGFLSNLVMGFLGATIPLFAEAVVFQTISVASLSFVGMIAGGAIGLNVLKDVLTLDGDLKIGYPTLAIKRGIRFAAVVGALFLLFSVLASPLPYLVGIVSIVYLIPVTVWGCIVVYSALSLLKNPNAQNVNKRIRMFTTSAVVYPIALIANAVL
ncbi:MAG: UbiA family prenyltransferase [Halobacteriota archaeon]